MWTTITTTKIRERYTIYINIYIEWSTRHQHHTITDRTSSSHHRRRRQQRTSHRPAATLNSLKKNAALCVGLMETRFGSSINVCVWCNPKPQFWSPSLALLPLVLSFNTNVRRRRIWRYQQICTSHCTCPAMTMDNIMYWPLSLLSSSSFIHKWQMVWFCLTQPNANEHPENKTTLPVYAYFVWFLARMQTIAFLPEMFLADIQRRQMEGECVFVCVCGVCNCILLFRI